MPTKLRIDLVKNQCPTKEWNRICQKTAVIWWKSCWKKHVSYLSDRATDGGEAPPPRKPAVGSHNILQSCQHYSSTLKCTAQPHSWTSWDMQCLTTKENQGFPSLAWSRSVRLWAWLLELREIIRALITREQRWSEETDPWLEAMLTSNHSSCSNYRITSKVSAETFTCFSKWELCCMKDELPTK